MFFYCLVFDPMQKTLLADKGEIRVGSKYQADITPMLNPGKSWTWPIIFLDLNFFWKKNSNADIQCFFN